MRRLAALLALATASASAAPLERLAPADEAKVRAANAAYVEAWRQNDPAAVLATVWPDAVLIPQGSAPVVGREAIRKFWWPPGSRTTIRRFTFTTDEIGGDGSLAWARGTFQFDFTYESQGKNSALANRGNYLNLFLRGPGGEWRISHRMWGDLPRSR